MPDRLSRRHFLGSSLLTGLALGLPQLAQTPPPAPAPAETSMPMSLDLQGMIRPVHDPCIIKDQDTYYVFCTGNGIPVRQSPDLINWKNSFPATVFNHIPDWAHEMIPSQTDFWAPDISFWNDQYHLYYAVSTFGKNRSVIGLATNKTLHSKTPDFNWEDQGLVVASTEANNYNCIDPNLVLDADGNPWLAFGSFWSGIKLMRLDPATGKPPADDQTLYSLARRTVASGSVEAPFIIHRGDYYYLFVSFDFCCRGVNSSYRVMVGRSTRITGPYDDKDGVAMLDGGGTQVTFPTDRWRGPGHNGILLDNGVYYIAYHAYDAQYNGLPTLRIDPLIWDADGWPSIPAAQ